MRVRVVVIVTILAFSTTDAAPQDVELKSHFDGAGDDMNPAEKYGDDYRAD